MDNGENLIPNESTGELKLEDTLPEEDTQVISVADAALKDNAENPDTDIQAQEDSTLPASNEPQQAETAAEPVKTVRRASPYADSPYVVNCPIQEKVRPKKAKRERRITTAWNKVLCAVLAVVILAGACAATGVGIGCYWEKRVNEVQDSLEAQIAELEQKLQKPNSGTSVSGSPAYSDNGGLTPAQVYARNVDSVVMIYNDITTKYNGQVSIGTSTGSGFILTEDGFVVTNHHVIEGDGVITVVTCDGDEYPAKLVGSDSTNDVALLKVEAEGLQPVALGSSTDLIVGDQVVAIGNPLGELTSTLTVGYISAKERDVTTDGFAINMLQTDAAINSGNSGGPLFNMRGEVIGITTAKYSGTSSSGASIEGVGFAIPIDDVSGLLSDLATYGYVTGAYLGVSVSDVDPDAANYYGMPVGAYVNSVVQGYAAQRGGIQPKDIITSVGGIRVENVNDLTRALRGFEAGDMTVITVFRSGKELSLKITLDEKPTEETQMPEGDFDEWYDYLAPFFGDGD